MKKMLVTIDDKNGCISDALLTVRDDLTDAQLQDLVQREVVMPGIQDGNIVLVGEEFEFNCEVREADPMLHSAILARLAIAISRATIKPFRGLGMNRATLYPR